MTLAASESIQPANARRAAELFDEHRLNVARRTDRMFLVLMIVQWIAGVIIALAISPTAWEGRTSSVHPHVWAAILLGALISAMPIALAICRPGMPLTRYVIAVAQMLWSGLLIHLSGGRIESHFHVFGSLAFLAFYRDWRVLVPATLVVAADHLLRGIFWPQSVYGVAYASPLRTFEHAGWVIFEDIFLVLSCLAQTRDMRATASRQAQLESATNELRATQSHLEQRVDERTSELARQNHQLEAMSEQLKHARDAAEQANGAKSAFLANMSHEIRTPMTAIVGYADLLLDASLDHSDRLNHVQTIRRNGEHLLSIINDILDISKIESNRLKLETLDCSPAQIVCDVASLMRVKAVDRSIGFEIVFDGPIPERIQSDPTRLRQIVLNLVSNAIKFTEQGSVRVVARFKPTRDGAPEAGGTMLFEVHDTGLGLTTEQQQKLFQPFTQADVSTTRRFGGTGLGLVICRRLAEMLGGTIELSSTVGVGSTFTLAINVATLADVPMLSNISEAMFAHPIESEKGSQMNLSGRILLAEDGIDNQRLISLLLRKAGAEVVVVDNGVKALQAVTEATTQQKPFDLILMDMQMPELDGYGATAKLRARGYKRPIVALTAHAMSSDRQKCLDAGCDEFLTKPIARDHLIQMAAKFIQGGSAKDNSPLISSFANDADMREIIDEFVTSLPSQVEKIQSLLKENNLDELRRAVHQLKGAGGGYGFDAITTAAASAEARIKSNEPLDAITQNVNELIDILNRARADKPQMQEAK